MDILNGPWFRRGLLIVSAIVFLFSSYKVGAYVLDSYENKKTYSNIKDLYYAEPEKEATGEPISPPAGDHSSEPDSTQAVESIEVEAFPEIQAKFTELQKQNEDIAGWLKIDKTKIDYPVVQAADNDYYLDKDVNKQKNAAGSIFMDYRNKLGGDNRNIILYGHNMKDGSMFADILHYESKWNFDNKSIIQFDSIYADAKWQIFSVYTSDVNFDYIKTDFQSDEEFKAFLDEIKAKSLHPSDIEVTENDRILTLSTCSYAYNDARFVVHAKLLQ
jgi:sortase B